VINTSDVRPVCTNPRTGGIDAIAVRVPGTIPFTRSFKQIYSDLIKERRAIKPDTYYFRRVDLRPYSISGILFDGYQRRPHGDRKLELADVNKLSAPEIRREITEVFDVNPNDLELMRVDLYADIIGIPVDWFHAHSYLSRKRSLRKYFAPDANEERSQVEIKGDIKTLMLGSGPSLIRIYAKADLWRQDHRKAVKLAKTVGMEVPSFQDISGHEGSVVVTRVERQLRGRAIPDEIATLGLLMQNAADFNPFDHLVVMSSGKPEPNPDDYDLGDYLRGIGARALIDRSGLAEFRKFVNLRSKNNAAKVFRQIKDFLPVDVDDFAMPDLTNLYQQGARRQLGCLLHLTLQTEFRLCEEETVVAR
jgi:hypothetical protein